MYYCGQEPGETDTASVVSNEVLHGPSIGFISSVFQQTRLKTFFRNDLE